MTSETLAFGPTECLASARRGLAWLLSLQTREGAWRRLDTEVLDAYYKGSWALAVMGEAAAAQRLLTHVHDRFLLPDGDLTPRGGDWHYDVHHLYANAYVIIGAHRLERYEISLPAVRYLLSQQDPDHGGFYSSKTAAGHKFRSDTMSTSACGLACLAAGHIEEARRVADHFARMIEMQPAPDERFFTTLEADGRLGTDFPQGETWWRVIDTRQANQCWYAVGLPFAFCVLLTQATGEKHYADLADWFFAFQSRCVNPWDGGSSGKAGWGCSVLYRITGERRYRDIALHVAQNIVGYQTASGWYLGGVKPQPGMTEPEQHDGDTFDATAEFVLWLALIASNIGARDGA